LPALFFFGAGFLTLDLGDLAAIFFLSSVDLTYRRHVSFSAGMSQSA
jgi:hypothetical protein